MRISQVQAALYRTARVLGDVQAVRRGRVPQRIVRRSAGKLASRLFRVLGLALAVVLAVAACGGSGSGSSSATTTTTVAPTTTLPAPGIPAFLAAVRAAGFGDKDVDAADNEAAFIDLANDICGIISNPEGGYGVMVKTLTEDKAKEAGVTYEQGAAFVKAAVLNFCPEYTYLLPT